MALIKYKGTGIYPPSWMFDNEVIQRYSTDMYYFCAGHPCTIIVCYGVSGRVKIFQSTDGVRICL